MGVVVRQKVKGKPWWVFIAHNGLRRSLKVGDKTSAEKTARRIREEMAKDTFNLNPEPKQEPEPVPDVGVFQKMVGIYGNRCS